MLNETLSHITLQKGMSTMRSLSIDPRDHSIVYTYSTLRRHINPTDIFNLPGMNLARQPNPTIVPFAKAKAFVQPFTVIEAPEGCSDQDARDHLIAFLADHPHNTSWKLAQVIFQNATIAFFFQSSTNHPIILQGDSSYFPKDLTFSLCTADNEQLELDIYHKGIQLFYCHGQTEDQYTLFATNQNSPRWLLRCYKRNDY